MSSDLIVKWTGPAKEQVEQMDDPRFNGRPQEWHEAKVRDFAKNEVPQATTARIR